MIPSTDKKDILYILATVSLFVLIGFYLAFTQGQSLSNVVLIPFRTNSITPTAEANEEEIQEEDQGVDFYALVETNLGNFEIDLLEKNAPNSVKNFVYLSESGYYEGTSFHRFVPNLILQGGSRNTLTSDKSDDKFGNPGYTIKDEINWKSLNFSEDKQKELQEAGYSSNEEIESVELDKYSVAWASTSPDSNGSQFFIVLGSREDPKLLKLEGRNTVFGRVDKGQSLIDEISILEVNLDNLDEPRPSKEIVIKTIKIEKR